MAYQNIKAELKRYGVSYTKVSELLDMSVNNVSLKMNERWTGWVYAPYATGTVGLGKAIEAIQMVLE